MPKVAPMPSGGGPGRGLRGRRVNVSLAEINIIPLVDVMLVLLIIFMVTAPMIQRGVNVNLPVSRRAQTMTGERVEVTVPLSYRSDHLVYLGNEKVRDAVLGERVRQKMETAAQKAVYLNGDAGINLGELYQIIDILKAAGVEQVGIPSQPARQP
jgi:biopolymer transport protein TolR